MKKLFKLMPVAAIAAVVFIAGNASQAACLGTGSSCFENTTVQVSILPGDICIGSTGAFDFGSYAVTSSAQTKTGAFATNSFYVDDLKGSNTGYYTTLQLSGNLTGPGAATIAASSVSVKVPATAANLITGSANASVSAPAGLLSFTPLNSAVTFLRRLTGTNNGLVGKYGTTPELQVIIPAYASVGTYTGTLVYTLYEF